MKKILFVLFLLIFSNCFAQQKKDYLFVSWHENQERDLAGYRVYWGPDSTSFDCIADVGLRDYYFLEDYEEGIKHYVAVTAYDSENNESDYSNITWFMVELDTLPPQPPLQKDLRQFKEKDVKKIN